ncbi:hypothetical protein KBY93_13550 [Synechococcus sp. J7-Johnson]|uniref:hypothetical protein n=1 Tax=Synechococcus sp. J7-Johnson TaxID=2823737 RepID=UPI0020CC5D35|nr:hypothetical protein [Synechococcus sp. J7-Johnson]MCP9841647.1 hypothetical protein [Synechococcus sp. J7-Johnson]
MTPTPNPFAWRPTDLEAIRRALTIPVTSASVRAINDEMASLERSYPDAIPGAKADLDAIALIDQGLAGGEAQAEPFITRITRKGAVTPVVDPNQLPKRKLDVIEYATELLLEEVSTEYAEPTAANGSLTPGAQRRAHVENLLLVLPRLRSWQAQQPTPFQGQLARG